jgi:toxin FitB
VIREYADGEPEMIVLDTNVISELMLAVPSPSVLQWFSSNLDGAEMFSTSVTMAEIFYGVDLLPKGKRRDKLQAEAEAVFAVDLRGRILSFDEQAARFFAEIAAARRSRGRPIAEFDAQIAAITRSHGAALATRNTTDFEGCGVCLIDPWHA